EQVDAVGDVGCRQQLLELQVLVGADHARRDLGRSRVSEVDAYTTFLKAEFLQLGGDRLGEVREGKRGDVDVVALLAHPVGVPCPVSEFTLSGSRDDYGAAQGHEGAAYIVQAPLPGSDIRVETCGLDGGRHFTAPCLEIDRGECCMHVVFPCCMETAPSRP